MHLESTIVIRGTPECVFDLATPIERWPEMLPHYRSVRVLKSTPDSRLAEMFAWRGWIPVRWQAVQRVDRQGLRIEFLHTKGVTRGMHVDWRLEPAVDDEGAVSTKVTITHDLRLAVPGLARPLVELVVGKLFIDHIASRTLLCMKTLAEAQAPGDA